MSDAAPVKSKRQRILGVDPGTRVAGYGILDCEAGKRPKLIAHGAIRFPPSPLAARLETLFRELKLIIAQHSPDVLSIEQIFYGKNFQSILKVGEARGVAVLAAQLSGLEIREYAPAMIKKAATGNGNAAKEQVQSMMGRVLDMEDVPEPVDASDALAAAFCHAQRSTSRVLSTFTTTRKARARSSRPGSLRLPSAASSAIKGLNLTQLLKTGKARIVRRRPRSP